MHLLKSPILEREREKKERGGTRFHAFIEIPNIRERERERERKRGGKVSCIY